MISICGRNGLITSFLGRGILMHSYAVGGEPAARRGNGLIHPTLQPLAAVTLGITSTQGRANAQMPRIQTVIADEQQRPTAYGPADGLLSVFEVSQFENIAVRSGICKRLGATPEPVLKGFYIIWRSL